MWGTERRLHLWDTVVSLQPCPGCGQPHVPEPMAFLTGLAAASEHLVGPVSRLQAQSCSAVSVRRSPHITEPARTGV